MTHSCINFVAAVLLCSLHSTGKQRCINIKKDKNKNQWRLDHLASGYLFFFFFCGIMCSLPTELKGNSKSVAGYKKL